jgi:hypothetical protein
MWVGMEEKKPSKTNSKAEKQTIWLHSSLLVLSAAADDTADPPNSGFPGGFEPGTV